MTVLLGACTAAAYAVISVASNFVTKYAMILLPGAPDAVLALQLATMALSVLGAKAAGLVSFAPLSRRRFASLAPLSLAYGAHAALVLRALAALNVPMYNTLKRLSPLLVLVAKVFIDKRLPGCQVLGSVSMVVAGCVVAGAGDLTFDPKTYSLAMLCTALQATYILLSEKVTPSSNSGSSPAASSNSGLGTARSLSGNLTGSTSGSSTGSMAQLPPGLMSPGKELPVGGGGTPEAGLGAGAVAVSVGHSHGSRKAGSGMGLHAAGSTGSALAAAVSGGVGGAGAGQAGGQQAGAGQGGGSGGGGALAQAMSAAAEIVLYASLTCLPILVVAVAVTGQHRLVQAALEVQQRRLGPAVLWGWMGAIAVMEGLLTGSLILCTQTNSALTTTVVGVLKGLLAVALGFVLLGGVGPGGATPLLITGITLNCLGGIWYAAAKYKEGKGGGASSKEAGASGAPTGQGSGGMGGPGGQLEGMGRAGSMGAQAQAAADIAGAGGVQARRRLGANW